MECSIMKIIKTKFLVPISIIACALFIIGCNPAVNPIPPSPEAAGTIADFFPFRLRALWIFYSMIHLMLHYALIGDPFDGKVWRDVRDCRLYWSIFYVLSFLMAWLFLATLYSEYFLTFPVILGNVFLTFLYFRMLGRVWFYSDEMREKRTAEEIPVGWREKNS